MTIDKNIFIKNIYYMLSYAFKELKRDNYEKIQGEEFDEIHQLLAEILILGVSFQLKKGLHREYLLRNENLSSVKGKIDIQKTIFNIIEKKQQIACEYDDLSENCLFNKIIKTAFEVLLSHPCVKKEQKKRVRELLFFFTNVDCINPQMIKWAKLRFDRNSSTYQMLLYVCFFLLDGLILTTERGTFNMSSFSDEHMCRLFEKFILEYYRKEHPETKAYAAQISWNIDEQQSSIDILPILQTDVFLTINDRILIIDAKYYSKSMQVQFDKVSIHSANLNQILVYVLNEDGRHEIKGKVDGMLLYAKTNESVVPDGQMKWRNGNTIYFRTLDLGVDFSLIRKQLDSFITMDSI